VIVPDLHGLVPLRNVHRRLLARRPGRDASLEQHCTLYGAAPSPPAAEDNDAGDHHHDHDDSRPGAHETRDTHLTGPTVIASPSTLVLTPILDSSGSLPYYHPTVFHIAFRYITSDDSSHGDPSDGGRCQAPTDPAPSQPLSSTVPRLQIEVVPFPDTPLVPDSRLYRTCLSLLETLHRYGWGAANDYKKRVQHDRLVAREEYQDLYLIMRERHKHLVDTWHESTDPLKHVFEVSFFSFRFFLAEVADVC
jgi:tRNASer (uridine44-2'-O)-methyltransferase